MTGSQYKQTSAAVLMAATAALTLPLFFPLISTWAPFMQCASLTIFRNPCPMCGLTRGFFNIWHLNLTQATHLNILSVPLFVMILAEVCFRAFIVIRIDEQPALLKWAKPDALLHTLLAASYFAYALCFVALRWNFTL